MDVSWLADAVLRPSTWRTNPQVLRSTGKGIEKWLATVLGHRDHAQWLDLKNILRWRACMPLIWAMSFDTFHVQGSGGTGLSHPGLHTSRAAAELTHDDTRLCVSGATRRSWQ